MLDQFTKILVPSEVNYGLLAHPRLKVHFRHGSPIRIVDSSENSYKLHLHSAHSRIDGLTAWHARESTSIGDTVTFTINEDKSISITVSAGMIGQSLREGTRTALKSDSFEVLDDLANPELSEKSLIKELIRIDKEMRVASAARVRRTVEMTIRRDTQIVRLLKSIAGYRCQFPNCGVGISKKDGSLYVEVAHITPIASGGTSTLGNLLVLCPNHHKEFDLGELTIVSQSIDRIAGALNGIGFEIDLLGSSESQF